MDRPDPAEIRAEEQEILEGAERRVRAGALSAFLNSVELVGSYPDTVLRLTASKEGRTQVEEFSIWDGQMTGSPPGVAATPRRSWPVSLIAAGDPQRERSGL
jgi:hypothetical protein